MQVELMREAGRARQQRFQRMKVRRYIVCLVCRKPVECANVHTCQRGACSAGRRGPHACSTTATSD